MTTEGKLDPHVNQHIQHEHGEVRQREREEAARRIAQGETPWAEATGVMAVVTAVRDVEFPCSFEELRNDIGDREVITTRDTTHSLADVLDVLEAKLDPTKDPLLEDEKVPSLRDFQSIVQRHWEAVRFDDVPEDQKPLRGGAQPQDPRTRG